MTAAAAPINGSDLHFTDSESKAVGYTGGLWEKMQDNAPRIVGALKMAGDLTAAVSLNPFLMGYAAFSLVGRVILMTWGTKANQQEQVEKARQEHREDAPAPNALGKVMRPQEYPVEASSGFSMVAEMFETGFGVSKFIEGGTGITATLMGLFAFWSYANILFGEEKSKDERPDDKKPESLTFAESASKPVGVIGRVRNVMKNNPVLVSSLVQMSCAAGMLIGGVMEGYGPVFIAYNVLGLIANVVQAALVRKNDFNVDGAKAEKHEKVEAPKTFEDKLVQRRNDNNTGLQPA